MCYTANIASKICNCSSTKKENTGIFMIDSHWIAAHCRCCIASSGCNADQTTLHKLLRFRLQMYQHQHGKELATPGIGQMLATTLYGRRFFPYYTFNVVGGLDSDGKVQTAPEPYKNAVCLHATQI